MADEKKIYVGNGNKRDGKYGTFRSVSICLSDLPPEHITKSEKNGKKYIKLNISDHDKPDKYNHDVSVTIDTWKPDPNYKKNKEKSQPDAADSYRESLEDPDSDNLPF